MLISVCPLTSETENVVSTNHKLWSPGDNRDHGVRSNGLDEDGIIYICCQQTVESRFRERRIKVHASDFWIGRKTIQINEFDRRMNVAFLQI